MFTTDDEARIEAIADELQTMLDRVYDAAEDAGIDLDEGDTPSSRAYNEIAKAMHLLYDAGITLIRK